MFAIIDIETCGSKFEFRRGRIIEICILVHDGLQVVDKYSTLVNPGCYINPFFRNLTGITNNMVANAPKFQDIAKKIIEMTEDRVFVAHNVSFDYNFIRDEFSSLGYRFRRETLCTVRLARKLIPGKISYSLGNLCASLGIDNDARHRAEGDAVATAKLFDKLLNIKFEDKRFKNMGVQALMTRRIDKIKEYILKKLPEECGVYYFLNKENNIIYIGKSVNMYNRALSHFGTSEKKGKKMLNDLYNVDFLLTGSELIALLVESEEIKKHKPLYNRQRKADIFSHSINWSYDEKGIINFNIIPYDESECSLMAFTTFFSAREQLDRWIEEHKLCINYCGLMGKDSICFNHHIRKCNGICAGIESAADYNKRASEIIRQFETDTKSYLLVDKGRNNDEKSVVLIKNGKYAGYGYIDSSTQMNEPDEIMGIIRKTTYYPDADIILRRWITQNRKIKKIILS